MGGESVGLGHRIPEDHTLKRFAYSIAAAWTPHGHAIHSTTKAEDEAAVRDLIDIVHGERAAAGASIWEVEDQIKHIINGRTK
jgi:hypothetical protein